MTEMTLKERIKEIKNAIEVFGLDVRRAIAVHELDRATSELRARTLRGYKEPLTSGDLGINPSFLEFNTRLIEAATIILTVAEERLLELEASKDSTEAV